MRAGARTRVGVILDKKGRWGILPPFMSVFVSHSTSVSFDPDQILVKNMGKYTQSCENHAGVLCNTAVHLMHGVQQVSRDCSRCSHVPMYVSGWLTGELKA